MPDPLILSEMDGHVAILTMNAPERLNALSDAMLTALDQALDALHPDARVVVLRGGMRAFSAGHDLREMQAHRGDADGGAAAYQALFARCSAVMQKIVALPQPVIAEVRGVATAAGCQLAASCDLVTASESARFGVNGINIGLFCTTPMVAVSRKIGPAATLEYLLTGEMMPAPRAEALGLVNRVCPDELLSHETLLLARQIAAKLPKAVRLGKAAFHATLGLSLADAYQSASTTMCVNLMDPDTAEGVAAFLDKRKPDWA